MSCFLSVGDLSEETGYSRGYLRRLSRENGVKVLKRSGIVLICVSSFFKVAHAKGLVPNIIKNRDDFALLTQEKRHELALELEKNILERCNQAEKYKPLVYGDADSQETDDLEIVKPMTLLDAKTEKEKWLAKSAELKFRKDAGELVERDKVKTSFSVLAKRVRDKILLIPGRVSVKLAGMREFFEIEQLLLSEFEDALASFEEEDV